VQRERQRERVAARVADVEILADRGDEGFAVQAVQALRHVEDDVGTGESELVREGLVGLEAGHAAEACEGACHRVDGSGLVPLGERIARTRGLVGVAGVRFLVVGETDSHVVSGDLLQKRPRVRSVTREALSCRQYETPARCAIGKSDGRRQTSDIRNRGRVD